MIDNSWHKTDMCNFQQEKNPFTNTHWHLLTFTEIKIKVGAYVDGVQCVSAETTINHVNKT